ncbi:MAG: DNA polymerase Y family protein [Ramlibacter sp.]
MHWLALQPPEGEQAAWGWRALQFTPRVAWMDEALVLEISGSQRLWGGHERLLRRLFKPKVAGVHIPWAQGATSFIAVALLRLALREQAAPAAVPGQLPLATLTAALAHLDTLERTGCRTWGQLRALPRGGVARRFGAPLLEALDAAWGERPERHAWLTLPEVFDLRLELPALATGGPELMWAAQRLLGALQVWLRLRQQGVLALELEWTHDLRRLDGVDLPRHGQLPIRTAQPTQDMAHLRRLMGEHLSRTTLRAPVNHLRLRTLQTAPWAGASTSLLPEDQVKGERLHELVERLSVRLGEHNVTVPQARADHRPERMQRWVPARGQVGQGRPAPAATAISGAAAAASTLAALYPPWLLPTPLPLRVQHDQPHYQGPLQMLTRAQRLEAGWWDGAAPAALRDYYIARSPQAGLVWVYCERPLAGNSAARWFLQGLYG